MTTGKNSLGNSELQSFFSLLIYCSILNHGKKDRFAVHIVCDGLLQGRWSVHNLWCVSNRHKKIT